MPSWFWFILLIVGLFFLFRRLANWENADFIVRVGPRGRVRIKGEIPRFAPPAVQDLVADLELPDGSRIVGLRDGSAWRVRVHGVDSRTEQRVRNVLFTRLPR